MASDFAIALHVLGFLTSRGGGPLTSDQMAHTYGTNAVVIRRVQSKLKKAGLIERWRRHYNTVRPHSALGYRPPAPEAIAAEPCSATLRTPQQRLKNHPLHC